MSIPVLNFSPIYPVMKTNSTNFDFLYKPQQNIVCRGCFTDQDCKTLQQFEGLVK